MKRLTTAAIMVLLTASLAWGQGYYGGGSRASNATGATVADTSDTSAYVALFGSASGSGLPFYTDAALTYNAQTGVLSATGFSGPLTGAVTGNASTATALAADPADCAAGQIATGIAASGALSCTATPSGLTSVGATTFTGALTGTATGNIANTLADASGDMIYASANDTWAKLTVGTTGQILTSNGTIPVWSSSLTGTFTFGNADTSAGFIYLLEDSDNGTNKVQLIGPASTDDVVVTLPNATGTLALVKTEKIASFAWDGGGSAVATAGSKRCTLIPVAYTVTGYNMVVDQDPGAGTTILNLDKDAIGAGTALATTDMDGTAHAYPPTMPDNKVAVNDTTITGWTTAVSANDMICATVATNAVATWISLSIYGTK